MDVNLVQSERNIYINININADEIFVQIIKFSEFVLDII